jgi:multicomponent Na+:H+ antiporter subunit D
MTAAMPLLVLSASLVTAVIIFLLDEARQRLRTAVNLAGALAKLALVAVMLDGVARGVVYETRLALLPELELMFRVDALALLFLTLSAFLWLLTTIYAIAYLDRGPDLSRFFGFFSLCVAATSGIAMSGTLISFFIFYELLTLSTWPLVVHLGDARSMAAGRRYLAYTLGGSASFLLGIVWLESLTGPIEFTLAGQVADLAPHTLQAIFVLLIGGLGVKAAIVPLHGWLPAAMVAPAPVSALLHAVAVVKAGAFGIVRIIYDVYGTALVFDLRLGLPLAILASVTILYASLRALQQTDIKRRLAFSTVSQVSYIALGAALFGPFATIGGLVHIVHQGLMKITLFFCAGALSKQLHITTIDELDGAGRRMPWTMIAFSIGGLGMIGVPPLAGFVTKWYLGIGALQAGEPWVILVLAASSLLNAAYFLPLIYRAWFLPAPEEAEDRCRARPLARRPPRRHRARHHPHRRAGRIGLQPARLGDADRRTDVRAMSIVAPILLVLVLALPLTLALAAPFVARPLNLLAWAALPGLVAALTLDPGTSIDVPIVVLGLSLAVDGANAVFLGAGALLWLTAGIYARDYMAASPRAGEFSAFWLVTLRRHARHLHRRGHRYLLHVVLAHVARRLRPGGPRPRARLMARRPHLHHPRGPRRNGTSRRLHHRGRRGRQPGDRERAGRAAGQPVAQLGAGRLPRRLRHEGRARAAPRLAAARPPAGPDARLRGAQRRDRQRRHHRAHALRALRRRRLELSPRRPRPRHRLLRRACRAGAIQHQGAARLFDAEPDGRPRDRHRRLERHVRRQPLRRPPRPRQGRAVPRHRRRRGSGPPALALDPACRRPHGAGHRRAAADRRGARQARHQGPARRRHGRHAGDLFRRHHRAI